MARHGQKPVAASHQVAIMSEDIIEKILRSATKEELLAVIKGELGFVFRQKALARKILHCRTDKCLDVMQATSSQMPAAQGDHAKHHELHKRFDRAYAKIKRTDKLREKLDAQ